LPAPGCGPEQLRVFHSEQCIAVHLQNMHLRICAAIKLCSVRHSSDSLIIFSKRSLTVLKKATALNLKRTIRSQVMFTEPWPESLQHGASRLCRGLDIVKNSQTCNNLYCFIFQFGGAWSIVWRGSAHRILPSGDGTGCSSGRHQKQTGGKIQIIHTPR